MLGWIADIFTGGAAGGIIGLLGSGVTAWVEYKNRKLKASTDIQMRKLDIEELEKEIHHAETLKGMEAQRDVEVSADQSFRISQQSEEPLRIELAKLDWFSRFLLVTVETFKRFTRPGITWMSIGLTIWLFISLDFQVSDLPSDKQADLLQTIVTAIVTVMTTSVTWWFGQRYLRPKFGGGFEKS